MTDDEIRDADGCEDYESLEESGLHDTAENDTAEEAAAAAEEADELFGETDDGEPEIIEEDPLETALQAEKDKYMRLFAEFDNYRKRTAKEKSETYLDAVAKTVQELLPAIDSFDRAMESPCTDEAYRAGMEKIYQQLTGILAKLGVEEIPALNEPFDPKVHNAIRQIEDESFGESTVCEVYQKGYRIGERIIRCAMVSVAN
ncbi:MAG: nucleotide exchange factor GrpE [Oscillospiraceae bacterium]|nr:nucleotide exchange factor GrpE [Oscillospiraceae bacterium]MCR5306986.1 nucleotide exchange factor GrpE [Oscillospiraceae bacterium]